MHTSLYFSLSSTTQVS